MNVPTTSPAELAECARRLEALVRRASSFVAQQIGQLDDIGLQMAAQARPSATPDTREQPGEVDSTEHTTAQQQRIDEQLEHLAKAWKELESEQRRLLMLERSAQQQTFEPAAATMPDADEVVHQPGVAADNPAPAPRRSRDLIDATAPQDAAAAALQFQKLKREIRQQTRRQR